MFEAKISLSDFCRVTDVEEEEFGDIGEVETLAGLLLALKGDFPTKNEALVCGRCRFLVLDCPLFNDKFSGLLHYDCNRME